MPAKLPPRAINFPLRLPCDATVHGPRSLYIPYVLAAGVAFAVASLMPRTVDGAAGLQHMMDTGRTVVAHVTSVWYAYAILVVAIYWVLSVKPSVYLVDYAVFVPPDSACLPACARRLPPTASAVPTRLLRVVLARWVVATLIASHSLPLLLPLLPLPLLPWWCCFCAGWKVSRADIVKIMERLGHFDQSALDFMARMLERSGTGEATHWPPATVRIIRPEVGPRDASGNLLPFDGPDTSIDAAREVTQTVMFGCMEELMRSTGLRGRDVDFLIVNCSLFCPTPSLASMVVQRFGLRQDIRSYNLGGMGCSAGLISIDLAKQLLENRPGSIAVVISLEDITQQLYTGTKRSMLLQNTLFRVGGSAIMLSNKPMDGFRAKYKLLHTVRVQDTSPAATGAVVQTEDETGKRGIELSKDLMNVAAKVLRDNLTLLGPHVLPVREQVKVVASLFARKAATFLNAWADKSGVKHLPLAPRTVPPQPTSEPAAAVAAAPPAPVVFCGVPATGGAGGAAVAPAADAASTPAASSATPAAGAAAAAAPAATGKPPSRDAPRPGRYPKPDVYVPDFKQGIHHFCIHAGGRAVIDGAWGWSLACIACVCVFAALRPLATAFHLLCPPVLFVCLSVCVLQASSRH